jgi:hypothetical protein
MSLKASEDEFELQSFSFMMENDSPVDTDFSYTHGGRLALLFSSPYKFFEAKNSFLSIAYSNQMYTPAQLDKIYHVKNDRPYAGYSFVELGLHQTDTNSLNSLSIELGMVGPSTDMDILQKTIHNLIGTKKVCGWDYQLKDEYIFQLNYQRKDRFRLDDYRGYENDLISYYGVQLGNKMTKLSGGALYRIGQNITDDFGVSSMNEANHSSVPTKPNSKSKKGTSQYINLAIGANLIARDIFLDGDTNTGSHYVDKNIFTAYIMAGFTYRYEEYKLDFFHSYYSEDYDQRDSYRTYRGYSSLVLTYAF